jgi:hypothetical protein
MSDRLENGHDSSWHSVSGSHSGAFVSMTHVRQLRVSTEEQDGGAERLKLAMNRALSELSVAVNQLVSQSNNCSDDDLSSREGVEEDESIAEEEAIAHRRHHHAPSDSYVRKCGATHHTVAAASSAIHEGRMRAVTTQDAVHEDPRPARYTSVPQQHVSSRGAGSRVSEESSSEGISSPDILSPWKARQIAQR